MSRSSKARRAGLSRDARARLVRAATAVSRDEWNRAYRDAVRIGAERARADVATAVADARSADAVLQSSFHGYSVKVTP